MPYYVPSFYTDHWEENERVQEYRYIPVSFEQVGKAALLTGPPIPSVFERIPVTLTTGEEVTLLYLGAGRFRTLTSAERKSI